MIDPIRERKYGDAFIVNFGTKEKTSEANDMRPQDKKGWHSDDDWYRAFLDSTGNAMTIIHCFSDIPPRGGGTWICEDGIPGVVDFLYNHPEGIDPPIDGQHCTHVKDCKQFITTTAKKGDVIILHGLLPHIVSPNYLHYARIISNPHVCLANPHNFNRPDGEYTLLEQVILNGLGRKSLPEWKPTRERQYWYPRNAGFKRAYAKVELERLEAAAKAKGLDVGTVDSLYQRRGTKEFEDFERRNGFMLPINPDKGLLMEQHPF